MCLITPPMPICPSSLGLHTLSPLPGKRRAKRPTVFTSLEALLTSGTVCRPGGRVSEPRPSRFYKQRRVVMIALIVLVLLILVLGGVGFAVHLLWWVLIAAIALWVLGFFLGGAEAGGRRRWYRRW